MKMFKKIVGVAATLAGLGLGVAAHAVDDIKIGVTFPLSGNSASAGKSALAAIELAAQIINEPHPELGNLTLAAGAGLPNLGGAKIKIVAADHQGNPSEGQAQALRLITQEKVVGLVGAYQSAVALTSTAIAERYGIPFIVGDGVAANITERGFKWTFRTTPIASDFATNYMEFLTDLKKAGHPTANIAIVFENTDYGVSVSATIREIAKKNGFNVIADIAYNANGADVNNSDLYG